MPALAPRLKALAKQIAALERDVAQGKDVSPAALAALLRLEACLQEIETILPARQRGRPRKSELALHLMRLAVDGLKTLPELRIKTDQEALQWLFRQRKVKVPINLKTWRNRLAQARKLTR